MTRLTRLYHAALGIPDAVTGPDAGAALRYTVHAFREAQHEHIETRLPCTIPHGYQLIEVETLGQRPTKWTVRVPLDTERDLVLVIHHNYQVRTVWVNARTDQHDTLNRARYDRVPVTT